MEYNEQLVQFMAKPNTDLAIKLFGKEKAIISYYNDIGNIEFWKGEHGSVRALMLIEDECVGVVQGVDQYISNVYVIPEMRRKRIGFTLMKAYVWHKSGLIFNDDQTKSGRGLVNYFTRL